MFIGIKRKEFEKILEHEIKEEVGETNCVVIDSRIKGVRNHKSISVWINDNKEHHNLSLSYVQQLINPYLKTELKQKKYFYITSMRVDINYDEDVIELYFKLKYDHPGKTLTFWESTQVARVYEQQWDCIA